MNNVRKILICLFLLIAVFSILFQIVLAQENETKEILQQKSSISTPQNATFLMKDIISTYFKEILAILAIISNFITFGLGMWYQNHRIKKSNIREKAKKLDEGIMKDLKTRANEVKKHIEEKNYISFSERAIAATLELNENEFVDYLYDSSIFRVKDNKIALIYQEDKILKKHAGIIQNIEKYQSEVSYLKDKIKNLNISDIPPEFEKKLRSLIKDDRGTDDLDKGERLNELLFIAYVVAISGSKNSYKSGRSCIIDIIEKRYGDLQNIARSDSKNKDTFSIIQNSLNNILSCLKDLIDEIEDLHEEWQNKLII